MTEVNNMLVGVHGVQQVGLRKTMGSSRVEKHWLIEQKYYGVWQGQGKVWVLELCAKTGPLITMRI